MAGVTRSRPAGLERRVSGAAEWPGAVAAAPGAAAIVCALLDDCTARRALAARERILAVCGGDEGALRAGHAPPGGVDVAQALELAEVAPRAARRIGRRLAAGRDTGVRARLAAVAAPERAYRQCDRLLPREHADGVYETLEIGRGRACLAYAASAAPHPLACALRAGMLEGLPESFEALPARVRERTCAARGAERCTYEVDWQVGRRRPVAVGALGAAAASAAAAALLPVAWFVALASLAGGLGAAAALATRREFSGRRLAGRSEDVACEIEARIAQGMDELAKLGAGLAARAGAAPARAERDEAASAACLGPLRSDLSRLGDVCEALRRDLAAAPHPAQARCESHMERVEALLRSLQRRADALGGEAGRAATCRAPVDLGALVEQAVRAARRDGQGVTIEADVERAASTVRCDAFQIEQAIEQLLRNACLAAGPAGRVDVSLRGVPEGVELCVCDDGAGIDPEEVERAFDPFAPEAVAGVDTGFGLPVCARIVADHGGALRLQGEPGRGTRASFVLPRAAAQSPRVASVRDAQLGADH